MRRVLAVLAAGLLSLAPVAAMAEHHPQPRGGGGGMRPHGQMGGRPMERPQHIPGPVMGGPPHYPGPGGDYRPGGYRPGGVVVVPGRNPYARPGGRVSLDGVISQMHHRFPGGRMLDAGVENRDGREVYRVRWATGDGRRVDYLVDAQTGAIVGVED
jgi:Peptidase propeptide and YPEB domain